MENPKPFAKADAMQFAAFVLLGAAGVLWLFVAWTQPPSTHPRPHVTNKSTTAAP